MKRLITAIFFIYFLAPMVAVAGPGPKDGGLAPVVTAGPGPKDGGLAPVVTAAGPGPKDGVANVDNSALVRAGVVRFRFDNLIAGSEEKDSMLIIFDRYDRAGAGVVRKVFVADGDQGVTVAGVAAGKYYITVQCIGLHRDRVERVVTIRAQRTQLVRVRLQPSEVFSKEDVVIPAFHPDPTDLVVMRYNK